MEQLQEIKRENDRGKGVDASIEAIAEFESACTADKGCGKSAGKTRR